MNEFLSGAIFLGFLAIGLFFFRFWQTKRDRLFLLFAAAFWVLSLERFLLLFSTIDKEFRPLIYVVRLVAYSLILVAIADKNRRSDPGGNSL